MIQRKHYIFSALHVFCFLISHVSIHTCRLSHIDYAIDKLNSRMKSEKAMSVVDANRFCVAIDAIIADAKTVHKQIKTGNNHTPTQRFEIHCETSQLNNRKCGR